MVTCLTGAKFSMKATILHQISTDDSVEYPEEIGGWADNQDPLTGEIVRAWGPTIDVIDDPDTVPDEEVIHIVNCLARGVSYKTGRDEEFGREYRALDSVNLWVPSGVSISRRDKVMNISTKQGQLLWTDEDTPTKGMVFQVIGVTPILDPFGRHTETFAVLERSSVD